MLLWLSTCPDHQGTVSDSRPCTPAPVQTQAWCLTAEQNLLQCSAGPDPGLASDSSSAPLLRSRPVRFSIYRYRTEQVIVLLLQQQQHSYMGIGSGEPYPGQLQYRVNAWCYSSAGGSGPGGERPPSEPNTVRNTPWTIRGFSKGRGLTSSRRCSR